MKTDKKGIETTALHPGWIKGLGDYPIDDDFSRIFIFFVINTLCKDLSSSSKSITSYGWNKDVWKKGKLRKELLSVANLMDEDTIMFAKKTCEMKAACEKTHMKKDFSRNRKNERVVAFKPQKYNQFETIAYHIRNAFAHGRFSIYPISPDDCIFIMEDGKKNMDEFQVRSRMSLKKSTLLKWIDIIEKKVPLEEATWED